MTKDGGKLPQGRQLAGLAKAFRKRRIFLSLRGALVAHGATTILLVIALATVAYSAFPWTTRVVTEEDWAKRPDQVWTAAEARELDRQLRAGDLGIDAALLGAGPMATDLSESTIDRTSAARETLNRVSAQLGEDYERQLARGGRFEAGSDYQLATLERLGKSGGRSTNPGFDPAYLKAVVAFRSGDTVGARTFLTEAGCDRTPPANSEGAEDVGAPQASLAIPCHWMDGRLLFAEAEGRTGAALSDATTAVRAALRTAIKSATADRNAGGAGQATATGATLLPILRPSQYMMNLTEGAGAALWQDYLSLLLLSDRRLCEDRCTSPQRGKLTDDGRLVLQLARQGQGTELWETYPELAVLTRLLLAREGWIAEARRITVAAEDDSEKAGFQIARGDGREVTLHPGYEQLAALAEIATATTFDVKDMGAPARQFWAAHAKARNAFLSQSGEAVANPFSTGNAAHKSYETFDAAWHTEISGSKSDLRKIVYVVGLGLGFLLLIWYVFIAYLPVRQLVKMHRREYDDVMESRYFSAPHPMAGDMVEGRG